MKALKWGLGRAIAVTLAVGGPLAWASGSAEGVRTAQPLAAPADPAGLSLEEAGAGDGEDGACGLADFAARVVELTNIERFKNGALPPVKQVASLDSAAADHSYNMAHRNFFAHCDLDTKKTPWERMRDAGYDWNWARENAATGYSTPEQVVDGWMNSSGHRAIMLGNYRELGVGYHYFSGDTPDTRTDANNDCKADGELGYSSYRYWTQDYGTRNGVFPMVINLEAHSTSSRTVGLYVHGEGWASEMRIRNDDGPWTPWMPFISEMAWDLGPDNGVRSVHAEIRSAAGTVKSASDEICLDALEEPSPPDLLFGHGFE